MADNIGFSRLSSLVLLMIGVASCAHDSPLVRNVRDSAGVSIVEFQGHLDGAGLERYVSAVATGGIEDSQNGGGQQFPFGAVVATNWTREVFVAYRMPNQIRMLGLDGQFKRTLGTSGEGPGELRTISALSATDSTLVVCHGSPSVVTRFSADGLVTYESRPLFVRGKPATCIGITNMGRHFVVELTSGLAAGNGIVRDTLDLYLVSDSGAFHVLGHFPGPELFKQTNQLGGQVTAERSFGRRLVVATNTRSIAIGSGDAFEIQVYDGEGQFRRIVRWDRPLVPVTDSVRSEYERMELEGAGSNEGLREFLKQIQKMMPYPEYLPAYRDIVLAENGDLWVQEYGLRTPGSRSRWIVFDSSANLHSVVWVPSMVEIRAATRDKILATWRDADDVSRFAVLSVESM